MLCIIPVSYTHLDVYKRQLLYGSYRGADHIVSDWAPLEDIEFYHHKLPRETAVLARLNKVAQTLIEGTGDVSVINTLLAEESRPAAYQLVHEQYAPQNTGAQFVLGRLAVDGHTMSERFIPIVPHHSDTAHAVITANRILIDHDRPWVVSDTRRLATPLLLSLIHILPELEATLIVNELLQDIAPGSMATAHITGRSGSGKSTLVREVQQQLESLGISCVTLSTDDYHRGERWLREYGGGGPWTRWDDPIVYDTKAMADDLARLHHGEAIMKRFIDFTDCEPKYDGIVQPAQVMLVEGIYAGSRDIYTPHARYYQMSCV